MLIFVLLFAGAACAKSFSLPKAEVYMKILPDGLVEAEENITFSFNGSFTFAYRDIPKGEWELFDVSVEENGVPLRFELLNSGSDTQIKWYYAAENETRTFTIKYKLRGAVKAYDDVAEFYWKVWGEEWGSDLDELYGWIELPSAPADAKEVYLWGHPEINGKLGLVEGNKILFQAFNTQSGQFVEVHAAFPVSLLSSRENAAVKSGNGLEKIIEQEAKYGLYDEGFFFGILTILVFLGSFAMAAAFTNNKALRVLVGIGLAIFFIWIFSVFLRDLILAGLLFVPVLFFAVAWYKWGREPAIEYEAEYERDVPYNYSPAVVSALMKQVMKKPGMNDMVAELLDLCLRGKLKLENIGKKGIFGKDDYKIHIIDSSPTGLPESEKLLLEMLVTIASVKFEGFIFEKKVKDETPNELMLSEIENYFKKRNMEAQQFSQDWQSSVEAEARGMDFFSGKNGILQYVFGSVAIAAAGYLILPAAGLALLTIAVALPGVFPDALPNRTAEGALHYAKWMKLKRFLKDFSMLHDVPPTALPLWEKFLVYSIPLGVAKEVQKAMDDVFKNYTNTRSCRNPLAIDK